MNNHIHVNTVTASQATTLSSSLEHEEKEPSMNISTMSYSAAAAVEAAAAIEKESSIILTSTSNDVLFHETTGVQQQLNNTNTCNVYPVSSTAPKRRRRPPSQTQSTKECSSTIGHPPTSAISISMNTPEALASNASLHGAIAIKPQVKKTKKTTLKKKESAIPLSSNVTSATSYVCTMNERLPLIDKGLKDNSLMTEDSFLQLPLTFQSKVMRIGMNEWLDKRMGCCDIVEDKWLTTEILDGEVQNADGVWTNNKY